ncbi:MAG: late competence development ComFB family protein [Butyribacter sp.]|nr:late competence development ComFB family protein [bacterium]MDY3853429.1 late competence development ComFB family protein [Butyribacter sp.]
MEGLTNLMEETVMHKIDQLWPQTDYCKCDRCRLDIAAYALNRLPARYVQSLEGAMLHKFATSTTQTDIEITTVVFKAIQVVGEEPHSNMGTKTFEE